MQPHGWPSAATALLEELAQSPGRLALVTIGPDVDVTLARLADELAVSIAAVGSMLTSTDTPPTVSELPELLGDEIILADIDILFWPGLMVHPVALLRTLARRKPRIALWPGSIQGHRATYSQLGRHDWFETTLTDTIVLTPITTHFPDEVPYTMERIPA